MLQKADVASVLAAEGHRSRTRRLVTVGGIVLAALAVVVAGWLWWSTSAATTAANFSTEQVARGDIHVTLVATGTLQPTHEVAVASLTSGTIASVDVDYDQSVAKGQALAHLDRRDLEARLRRSLAMVDAQRASRDAFATTLSDAAAALKRSQGLQAGQLVSTKEVELAVSAVQRATANLAAAEAQLQGAEADLQGARNEYGKGTITSPVDGIVLAINAEVGQTIGSASLGASLFTIASDLRALDLEADIDEADVATVKVGDKASFTVEASPDQPFAGIVRQVRSAPALNDGVVSYKALVSVDNSSLALKPGMTATAEISIAEALGVLRVPNTALRYSPTVKEQGAGGLFGSSGQSTAAPTAGSDQAVWVLRNEAPTKIAVTIGVSDGRMTEITAGLKQGDLVITGTKAR